MTINKMQAPHLKIQGVSLVMYVSQSFLVTTVMTTLRSPRGDLAEAQFMARSGGWQHGEVGGQDAGMVSVVTRPPSTLYMAAGARPIGDWCRGAPCRVPVSASPAPGLT